MTIQAAREYLADVWVRYQEANKREKGLILDELQRNLGLHRKSATRLMNSRHPPRSHHGFRGGRKKKYSEEAKFHLRQLWKIMGYMAPIRMRAALPEWIPFYEYRGFNEELKMEILAMSTSSINRFLQSERAILRRKMNTGTRRGQYKWLIRVPIRDLEITPKEPGHCEIDCVAHCGTSMSGTFAWTVNMTDIATGWTECEAIWGKDGASVRQAIRRMKERLPFPLKAIYFDNGSEFLNKNVIDYFIEHDCNGTIKAYRGRPYRKNDQCYVEQKNHTHVRALFGYARIDKKRLLAQMNHLYRKHWRHIQNFFMPQQKLVDKFRIGARMIRKLDRPRTPYDRLIDHIGTSRSLAGEKRSMDPIYCRRCQTLKVWQIYRSLEDEPVAGSQGRMVV